VLFQSAASTMAVCSFCRSTLVRDGEVLRRIGQVAELFDDHSPLQLGMRGSYQGEAFALIGRVQLAYHDEDQSEGRWSEWHALFDSGRSACLSEDNGAYVLSFPMAVGQDALPDLRHPWVGDSVLIAGRPWTVSAVHQVHVHTAQGELDHVPDLKDAYPLVECRNTEGEVLSIEPQATPPRLDVGRSVELSDLKLMLDAKAVQERSVKAKGVECPQCGAAVTPVLTETQSITCGQCRAVIDISRGVGADLRCYRQLNSLEPLIPLGRVGQLKVGARTDRWQVVGYQERCDSTDDSDEQVFWREYLLYNSGRGFAFLVDSEDGWSVVRPITGVPKAKGQERSWQGVSYRKRYEYKALTTYVLGEFYWQVSRGQKTSNRDFGSSKGVLSLEQSRNEVTWSAGDKIASDTVAKAFKLDDKKDVLQRDDPGPFVAKSGMGCGTIILIAVVIIFLLIILSRCSSCDPRVENCSSSSSYRSSGGSYGGYSSGGGHK